MHQRLKEGPMDLEPVPSGIVARLLEAAKELEEWAVEHRQATLAEHEKGVLRIFRRVMGPALGAVLERALGLDHPAAQRHRAACPECGVRRRPHQWRNRQPVSVCGETPFERPYYWCAACQRGWVPADEVLGLGPHQILSAELQAWVAATGAELPFQQAAEQLERLAGIGLGIETVRTHTEQIGTALAERQHAAATAVAQTQEAAEPVEMAPELLVAEVDGVHVRFQDGWHEAKVGEIAGCRVGNGLPDTDPMARPPVLWAPSYGATPAQSASSARCSWLKQPDAGCSRWWTGPNPRTPIRAYDWSVRPKRSCGRWWSSATAHIGSGKWPPSTSLPSGSRSSIIGTLRSTSGRWHGHCSAKIRTPPASGPRPGASSCWSAAPSPGWQRSARPSRPTPRQRRCCGWSWVTSPPMRRAWTTPPSTPAGCRSAQAPSSRPPSTSYKSA